MPKLDVDRIISKPKNTLEEVATIFFIIMTCPDVKKHEDKLVLHLEVDFLNFLLLLMVLI